MIKINSNSNGFSVEGVNNVFYPDNGTLVFAANTVIMLLDESEMVTFRSAANNDVLFSGLIGQIQIDGATVTKDNIIEKFDEVANKETGGGGDMDDYYTKSETDALLADKADTDDIPTDNAELANGAGYITNSALNGYATEQWVQSQGYVESSDLATVATSGSYDDLSNKPTIPTVPTNVSAFTNDAGYLTEHQSLANYYTKTETDALIPNVEDYFDGAEYDSNTKRINFKHGNTIKAYIDATAFIKDGMVDNVEISNGNLVITFNTDAGKQPISIPLTDIFNPANYYDKTTADNTFATQVVVNQEIAARIQGDADINTALGTKADKSDTYTKTEVDTALALKQDASTAFSGDYNDLSNKPDLTVYAESADLATVATSGSYDDLSNKPTIPTVPTNVSAFTNDAGYLTEHQSLANYYTKTEVDTELADKQDKLTAGSNITIDANNVISATGGGGVEQIQSDWNQTDTTAVDYIKNKPTIPDTSDFATKTELNAKQDALISGTNIKTINNESILGEGNIEIQGGGGGMNEDTELLISSALVDLNDRKIDATEVKENYQKKGDYATNAKVDTKANISDVPTNEDYEEAQKITSWSLNDLNKNKADKTEIPDISNYYTKTEIDAMIGDINTILASI